MATRPNILLILSDQHNSKIAGFAGDTNVQTQNLDALAERSVQFTAATCTSPVCTPSRMSILTGKDVHHCGAWNNHWVIFPEHTTWPEYFADNGYRTGMVGKMHFGGRDQMQGFQVRPYGDLKHGLGHQPEPLELFPGYAGPESAGETEIPESLLSDVVITRETLAFLREHDDKDPDTPWFVCAGYTRPHSPFTAPGRYIRRYRDKVAATAPTDPDDLEPYARHTYDRVGYGKVTPEQSQRAVEGYYACVDFVDDCIGELLDGLDKDGLLENTIIIYTSDHGEMLGRHGLWAKEVYYDESIEAPLLMTGPGIAPGAQRVDHPFSLMDLFPTCCGLAGLAVPPGLDGVDFSKLLANPDTAEAPRSFSPSSYYKYAIRVYHAPHDAKETESHRAMRVNRRRRWKYVAIEGGDPLLFDMEADPEENNNLAGDPKHGDLCREMHEELFAEASWEDLHRQLDADRKRIPEYLSGVKPSMPNQYMLEDGRIFDAEAELYGARWLYLPEESNSGGIIPQMFG